MIDLDKIEADALAATPGPWTAKKLGVIVGGPVKHYTNGSAQPQIVMTCSTDDEDGNRQGPNAAHIANTSPETTIKLLAVVRAADNYYRRYAQDEADEYLGCELTGCTVDQHKDAVLLRDALKALEAS